MASLVIKSKGFEGKIIQLKLGPNRFGRSPKNDFQIEHATVSAHHCDLILGDGFVTVRDFNSTNGTYVDGKKIRVYGADSANVSRLQTSLARVPHTFLILRQDTGKPVVWLAGTKSNSDVLERAARSAYLNPLVLPEEYQGTPSEIIKSLRDTIARTQKHTEELNAELAHIGQTRGQELRELLDRWPSLSPARRRMLEAAVRAQELAPTST